MSRTKRRYLLPALVVIAAGSGLGSSSSIGRSAGTNPTISFSTIPAAKMAAAGIDLSAPQAASPSASAGSAAAAAASSDFPGRSVLEYHYAHCVDDQSPAVLSEDCWAVSLDPSGLTSHGPPSAVPQPFTYLLVFIDPTSNKFIEAATGA